MPPEKLSLLHQLESDKETGQAEAESPPTIVKLRRGKENSLQKVDE